MTQFSKAVVLLIFTALLTSCGATKNNMRTEQANKLNHNKISISSTPPDSYNNTALPEDEPEDSRVYNITSYAKNLFGTKYKYGGTTEEGMDCSGLVYTSFLKENINLPRSSRAMALEGEKLDLEEVTIGDLLFFETDRNKKVINHVGLVVEVQPGQILFIHSTTSRGVVVSSLTDDYWNNHFVMARRVI